MMSNILNQIGGDILYPNRYVCTVLEEMRKQLKTLDENNLDRYKSIAALMIEEAQTMVNKMEAGLEDYGDIRRMKEERDELYVEIKKLKAEKKELKKEEEE
jgi:hypothetical protein